MDVDGNYGVLRFIVEYDRDRNINIHRFTIDGNRNQVLIPKDLVSDIYKGLRAGLIPIGNRSFMAGKYRLDPMGDSTRYYVFYLATLIVGAKDYFVELLEDESEEDEENE